MGGVAAAGPTVTAGDVAAAGVGVWVGETAAVGVGGRAGETAAVGVGGRAGCGATSRDMRTDADARPGVGSRRSTGPDDSRVASASSDWNETEVHHRHELESRPFQTRNKHPWSLHNFATCMCWVSSAETPLTLLPFYAHAGHSLKLVESFPSRSTLRWKVINWQVCPAGLSADFQNTPPLQKKVMRNSPL